MKEILPCVLFIANALCCWVPKTTDRVKIINAKSIRLHSDIVGIVGELVEHEAGAVPALLLVSVQAGLTEKEAVKFIGSPFAGIVMPVKV